MAKKNALILWIAFVLFSLNGTFGYSYCQAPEVVESQSTEGLKLVLLQVLTRHGDRTPTCVLPQEPEWICQENFLQLFSNNTEPDIPKPPRLYRKTYIDGREELPGNCSLGQLTQKGIDQHFEMGSTLRDLYVNKYKLLPSDFQSSDIYVRSTDVPRTVQSVMGNLWTFFPPEFRSNIDVVDIHTMDITKDDMYPNGELCPKYNEIMSQLFNTSEAKQKMNETAPFLAEIEKILNLQFTDSDWGCLWDNLGARMCHDKLLPSGITDDLAQQIYDVNYWILNYTFSNDMVGQLGSGMLLQEIYQRILNATAGQTSPLLYFYSGHDSTIGPLMGNLGVFNGWPPYASHVIFELWQSTSDESYYVQLKYNGEIIVLPGCTGNFGMCPFDQFSDFVTSRIPANFAEACQV